MSPPPAPFRPRLHERKLDRSQASTDLSPIRLESVTGTIRSELDSIRAGVNGWVNPKVAQVQTQGCKAREVEKRQSRCFKITPLGHPNNKQRVLRMPKPL